MDKKYVQRGALLSTIYLLAAYLAVAFVMYDLFWLNIREIGEEGRFALLLMTGVIVAWAVSGVSIIWKD